MTIEERVMAFHNLGNLLKKLPEADLQSIAARARQENPWFTLENVRMAVSGIRYMLTPDKLSAWIAPYNLSTQHRKIAVVMAGNIPLVGFHDFLTVLLCGHSIIIKCSAKDSVLIHYISAQLAKIEPRFEPKIEFSEQLKGFDAIIATGSDNTSRYFEYYFGKYPNVIRKNRTSVAILHGEESDEELEALGTDVFSYFGLGCRNVSKLYLPKYYSFEKLFRNWESFREIIHHHKYCNNYDYQKTVLLMKGRPFLDNGFVMLLEEQKLVSPIASVYYEYYEDRKSLDASLLTVSGKIQCVVENTAYNERSFGRAQFPVPWDYADQVDTIKFLTELN